MADIMLVEPAKRWFGEKNTVFGQEASASPQNPCKGAHVGNWYDKI